MEGRIAPIVPTSEPTAAVAGDTWTWTHASVDFPVSEGWALSYSFRGISAPAWSTAYVTNDGQQWTVTIPATITAAITAGVYVVERHYTLSAQRYTSRLHSLEVAPNAATAAAGVLQTFNEKMLAALQSLLYGTGAISDVESYQIHGRAITKMNRLDLQKWYDIYAGRVLREQNGGRNPSIRIAFGNAR